MNSNRVDVLIEKFGETLVKVARDYTISLAMNSLENNKLPDRIKKAISNLSNEQLFALKYLLIKNIDTAIHDTLWAIESYPNYKVIIEDQEQQIDLDNELDSLTGATLCFVDEYSKYNSYDELLKTERLEKI